MHVMALPISYKTSRVNIDFYGKFWHSTHEKLCGTIRGMCEVVVELYHIYTAKIRVTARLSGFFAAGVWKKNPLVTCMYVCMYSTIM